MQIDSEVASLVIVGGLVAVAFFVIDFDGIENQVRFFRGNRLDEVLVAVLVLFGDGEFYSGSDFLWRDVDLLQVARGNIEADDLSVGSQTDGGAFIGFQCVLVTTCG